jgi:hypothetical protein
MTPRILVGRANRAILRHAIAYVSEGSRRPAMCGYKPPSHNSYWLSLYNCDIDELSAHVTCKACRKKLGMQHTTNTRNKQ